MNSLQDELASVLSRFNPWWRGSVIPDLPSWRRAAFGELYAWVAAPPAPRALILSGARQVGKTTLLLQAIDALLKNGVPAANILYATFDHPIIRQSGIEEVLHAWRDREPEAEGLEYLFLDEAHNIEDWGTWLKLQVDFNKQRRIILTGSATPLAKDKPESGVGRWHTMKLGTLSFYEYLRLRGTPLPDVPAFSSFISLFDIPSSGLHRYAAEFASLTGHFNEYLLRGGYPQTSQIESIPQVQRLLREDIIDKVLKRDMTAMFGVRLVLELENTFLYLCMHNGGLLDMQALSRELNVRRPTAQNFIELLEAAHLLYRLPPFGYGKNILRGKFKIYLADPSLAPAMLLRGKRMLDNPGELGPAIEAAVLKHLHTRFYRDGVRFTYWRGKKEEEVDLLAEFPEDIVPFEVKYRAQRTDMRMLKGLAQLMAEKNIPRGYAITSAVSDFGILDATHDIASRIMRIPASVFCYWMGESETHPPA